MATRNRKVRRQRGSRTHGWGQIGQHRHSGSRGGTGMAGMHKHKWSYTVKYAPDHFGRNAFSPPNRVITRRWLNVSDLEAVSGKSSDIDLSALGYDKLLGNGEVKRAVNVTISRASASAIEKVKAAGGSVKLDSKEPEEKRAIKTPSSEQSSKNSKERVSK